MSCQKHGKFTMETLLQLIMILNTFAFVQSLDECILVVLWLSMKLDQQIKLFVGRNTRS